MSVKSKFAALPKPDGILAWELDYSTRNGKKWMVRLKLPPLSPQGKPRTRSVHFGDSSMEDYTQHGDPVRRKRFHQRFAALIESTKNDPLSPMYYSAKLLW